MPAHHHHLNLQLLFNLEVAVLLKQFRLTDWLTDRNNILQNIEAYSHGCMHKF